MTEEEYEAQRRRIEANIADAKKALNNARAHYDGLCNELRNLHINRQVERLHAEAQALEDQVPPVTAGPRTEHDRRLLARAAELRSRADRLI